MKLMRGVLYCVLLSFPAWLVLRSPNSGSAKPATIATPISVPVATAPKPMASRPKPPPARSERCQEFHKKILALDLSGASRGGESRGLEIPLTDPDEFLREVSPLFPAHEDACGDIPASDQLFSIHSRMAPQCESALLENDGTTPQILCFHFLQRYRAALVAEQAAKKPLDTIRDEGTLRALLYTSMFGKDDHPDIEAMTRIAARLEVVAPEKHYGELVIAARRMGTDGPDVVTLPQKY